MKRKLLSLILVAALLASMAVLVPTASATETLVTLTLGDDVVAKAGETVEIDVVLQSDEPLLSYTLCYTYDASKMKLTNVVDHLTEQTADGPTGVMNNNLKEGATYKEVLSNGPYAAISWGALDDTGRDISAGVAVATLVFTVNANVIGDASVEFLKLFRADGYDLNSLELGANKAGVTGYYSDAVAYADPAAKVTVIPADYMPALEMTDADWDFSKGAIAGFGEEIYDAAAEYTGTIVIPSEINGEAVTDIDSGAFDGISASVIVIPASVTYIGAAAIYNCENLSAVYVMNPEAEYDAYAIGYEGKWKKGEPSNASVLMNGDVSLTTIYAAAESTGEAYATAGGIQFAASAGLYSISFAGQSFLTTATTKAPGTMMIDGKTVVAWTDGTQKYLPGAEISLTGDIALDPVIITAPQTATDVDFKITAEEADLAMRFTSSMSKADYAKLAELGSVELGMLITPAAYVAKAGAFTKEALDALKATNGGYVDIAIDGYYKETADDYIFAGSLKGFSAKTLAKNPDFAAILYATVTTDAGVFTVYGDFNFDANQDVKSVAESLSNSDQLGDLQKGWLETLVGKFTV